MTFQLHEQNALQWLTAPLPAGVRHGFSTRIGGVSLPPFDTLNLAGGRGDPQDHVQENFTRFCAALEVPAKRVVLSRQTHTANVLRVGEEDAGKGLWCPQDYQNVDALITDVPDLPLTVFSADCGTLLLFDPVRRAVGAIHAGWRGCAAGIVSATVSAMVRNFGTCPCDVFAALGPCIQSCCFETDDDVPEAMRAALGASADACLTRQGAKWHVDLSGLNRLWLLESGVPSEQIFTCPLCTACRPDLFWSHRKMGDARGGQAAMIALSGQEASA